MRYASLLLFINVVFEICCFEGPIKQNSQIIYSTIVKYLLYRVKLHVKSKVLFTYTVQFNTRTQINTSYMKLKNHKIFSANCH